MCTVWAVFGEIFLFYFLLGKTCRSLQIYAAHWQIQSDIVRKLKNHLLLVFQRKTVGNHLITLLYPSGCNWTYYILLTAQDRELQ